MTRPTWTLVYPRAKLDILGYIPLFLVEEDPRPAKEQFNDRYRHGGGWFPTPTKFQINKAALISPYPEDPPLPLIAHTVLHANSKKPETIQFYLGSYVAILQKDGTFEIARMD